MDKLTNFDDLKLPASSLAAVGLIVSDSASCRMGVLTMMCCPEALRAPLLRGHAIPELAMALEEKRRMAMALKALSPLIGEMWSFAAGEAGGVPVKTSFSVDNPKIPTVAIVKKIASKNWAESMGRAEKFSRTAGAIFGSLIQAVDVEMAEGDGLPSFDEPELSAFSKAVLKNAQRGQSEALRHMGSREEALRAMAPVFKHRR